MRKGRFILIATVLFALCMVVGCNKNPTDDTELRARGYFSATLHCNGGNINGREWILRYALPDSPITRNGEVPVPYYPNEAYELEGWYRGEMVNDEVVFGERWDFSADYMGNEDFTLYAKWTKKLAFTLNMGVKNKTDSNSMVLLYVSSFADVADRTLNKPVYNPEWEGYTFVEYYTDSQFTSVAQFPISHSGQGIEHTLYARFIEGDYTIVRTPQELSAIKPNSRLYLLNNIDMTGEVWNLFNRLSFTGEIVGDDMPNGEPVQISGISSSISKSGTYTNYENFGLFGNVSGAKFKNVAFTNCTFILTLPLQTARSPLSIGLLAGLLQNGTEFTNVSVSGSVIINNFNGNTNITHNGFYGKKTDDVDVSSVGGTVVFDNITD